MSDGLTHAPLVDDATFLAVRGIRSSRPTKDGHTRRYQFAGLVVCGVCGRRMDAHWSYGRAAYRCRHGYTSARPRPAGAPRNVYHREDQLLAALPALLATAGAWTKSSNPDARPDPVDVLRREQLQIICAHQGVKLRLESSPDPTAPAIEPVQTAFELAWNSRMATDRSGTLSVSAHGSI